MSFTILEGEKGISPEEIFLKIGLNVDGFFWLTNSFKLLYNEMFVPNLKNELTISTTRS